MGYYSPMAKQDQKHEGVVQPLCWSKGHFSVLTYVAWCTTECFAEGRHRSAGETSNNFLMVLNLLFVQLTRPRRNWLG